MSEESTKTAAEAGDAAAGAQKLPTEVELKVRGKNVKVSLEKAVTLAQQAMVQAQNAERLNAERAEWESKATRYKEFEQFTGHLEGHPDAAQAVQLALKDPARFLQLAKGKPKQVVDDDDPYGEQTQPSSNGADEEVLTELRALRQEISGLKAKDTERDAADAAGERAGAIDTEIADYPWLKSPKMASLAKAQIANTLASTPGADLASVTAIVATDFREALEAEKTLQVKTARTKTKLRTERPTRGTPVPGMDKPPTKKDLLTGGLLKPLKQMARNWGFENVD